MSLLQKVDHFKNKQQTTTKLKQSKLFRNIWFILELFSKYLVNIRAENLEI